MATRIAVAVALVLAAAVSPAAAAVSVGHSGWFWGNPTPQGNSLDAVEFSGQAGYAAGRFGTILRTVDGGSSWTGLRTGITADLSKLEVIDGDSFVAGSTCAIRRSDDAGQSFRRLPFTPSESRCSRRLADISFPDANTGYLLLENGGVLTTPDGGRSFSPRGAIPGTQQAGGPAAPTALEFATPDLGYATTSAGGLFRTVDGGESWQQAFTSGNALNGLFAAGSVGVAVGENGTFVVSTNGGANWTETDEHTPYTEPFDFTGVRCSSGGACLMTTRSGEIARTTNGGRGSVGTNASGSAVDFASSQRAVAVGALGATFVSDDGGESFRTLGRRLSVVPTAPLRATSAAVAHVPGARGALGRTTDGGATWTNVGAPTSEDVVDASFPAPDTGYALDADGGLFRTDNGGETWGILDTGTNARPNAVFAPDATVVLLVGPRGMLRSNNSGETFSRVGDGDVRRRTLVDADRAGGAVVAFGPRVIAASTNRGARWTVIRRPSRRSEVLQVDFVSATTGFVLLEDGRVFSTRNAGRRWRESLATGTHAGNEIAFGDAKNGWLAIDGFTQEGAYVLRTSNGGATWRPQLLGVGEVGSIAAGSTTAAFANLAGPSVPQQSQLLATGNGGEPAAPAALSLSTRTPSVRRGRRVELRGSLPRGDGGQEIVVSARSLTGRRWTHVVTTTATDGGFTVDQRVRRPTVFVAQWRGDAETGAAASRAVLVEIAKKRR